MQHIQDPNPSKPMNFCYQQLNKQQILCQPETEKERRIIYHNICMYLCMQSITTKRNYKDTVVLEAETVQPGVQQRRLRFLLASPLLLLLLLFCLCWLRLFILLGSVDVYVMPFDNTAPGQRESKQYTTKLFFHSGLLFQQNKNCFCFLFFFVHIYHL